MSQLESLLSIAQMQSDKQLAVLRQKKQLVSQLIKNHTELSEYSRAYQKSAVGVDGTISSLLIHRQHFISRLGIQIDELTLRIAKLEESVADAAKHWRNLEARRNAIASMSEEKRLEEKYSKNCHDQSLSDDLARSRLNINADCES